MPENGIKDAKKSKQFSISTAAQNPPTENQKGKAMKKAVLFLALLLTACGEPLDRPKDFVDVGSRSNDLKYYGLVHKILKLNDGREIECLINTVNGGYAMDCNWNYKGNQDKER